MMLRFLGWQEAADLVRQGIEAAIRARKLTFDLARQIEGSESLERRNLPKLSLIIFSGYLEQAWKNNSRIQSFLTGKRQELFFFQPSPAGRKFRN